MAFPSDYNWKVDITSDSTQVDSNETDFPYYFDLSNISSTDFWNNVQSDGGDLRVSSDSSGSSQLPLEVVSIDTGAQTGEIHFKDDTDSASDKVYYLWWEDSTGTVSQPAVTDTFGRNNVWTNYLRVYHLESTSATDSTGNVDGTLNGNPTVTSGQLGDSFSFDGDDYVACGDTGASESLPVTVTSWFKQRETISTTKTIVSEGNTGDNTPIYRVSLDSNNLQYQIRDDSGTITDITGSTTYDDDIWHYAVAKSSTNSNHELRVDGTQVGTDTTSIGTTSVNNMAIGVWNRTSPVNYYSNGEIDEVRLTNSNLSTGWTDTEYNIQSSNSTFWTVGTPEDLGATEKSTTFSMDALIFKADNTQTFSFDARIQKEKTKQFQFDAIIENRNIGNAFSMDAKIKKFDESNTFSMDSIISLQGDVSFTMDATLKNSIENTFSMDALIFKADNTQTFSFDTIISNPIEFSFDTLIKKQDVDPTFSFDAIIKEKQLDIEQTFTLDTFIVTAERRNEVNIVVEDINTIFDERGKEVTLLKADEQYDSMDGYIGNSNEQKYQIRAIIFPQGQRDHNLGDLGNVSSGQQQIFIKDKYDVNGTIVVPKEGDELIDPQGKRWRITQLNEWVWDYEVIYMEGTVQNIDLTGTTR